MARMENLAIVAKALRGYKQAIRQGKTDLANQYAAEVEGGIQALKGITGIQETQQRMTLERAEERHRVALRPHEVTSKREAAEQAELTTEQLEMELEENRKTIESLTKQLRDLGLPERTTVPALVGAEKAAGVVERRAVEMPRVTAEAGAREEQLRKIAAEVEIKMREEELAREIPEKTVAAREEELETVVAKADYEQLTLKWLTEMDIPEHDARTKSMLAGKAMERADAEIKLMKGQARKAEADADRFGYEQDADAAIRQAYKDSGLDFNDFLITRAKIKAGVMPAANETMQNIEDGNRIYAQIKARGPGDIDPMDLMAMEVFAQRPGSRELIQQLLPKPEDREAALEIMMTYIKSQKTLWRSITGIDYDALSETALLYSQEDLDTARTDLGITYSQTETAPSGQVTEFLDTLALRLLNDPNLMRDEVLSGIQDNRTEGVMFDQMYGLENMDKFYRLMAGIQGVWQP